MQTQTHYRSGQLGPCKSFFPQERDEAPCSDFTLQSPQIRSKFCRGRARKQAWDAARAEHRCRAKALVRTKAATLGIPLGPNQGADKDNTVTLESLMQRAAPARTKAARLASPLGIPLGPCKGKRSHARDPARDPARGERGCHAKASLLRKPYS